jgi:hypothetical protein
VPLTVVVVDEMVVVVVDETVVVVVAVPHPVSVHSSQLSQTSVIWQAQ